MARKRKRRQSRPLSPLKRTRTSQEAPHNRTLSNNSPLKHPLLSLYYPRLVTLRHHLLSVLSVTSKARRRRLASVGLTGTAHADGLASSHSDPNSWETDLAQLLDGCLVGTSATRIPEFDENLKGLSFFSQQHKEDTALDDVLANHACSHSEIIDYALWTLFYKVFENETRPPHVLCRGYDRTAAAQGLGPNDHDERRFPGLIARSPNDQLETLKAPEWGKILKLMGTDGEKAFFHLLLKCSLFAPIRSGTGNYYQLSGTPVANLDPIGNRRKPAIGGEGNDLGLPDNAPDPRHGRIQPKKKASAIGSIALVRVRMLHARTALDNQKNIRMGLQRIHALNRYPDWTNSAHTLSLLKYIFPRQFGLHNVFTSAVDSRETIQSSKDYTLREEEIARARALRQGRGSRGFNVDIVIAFSRSFYTTTVPLRLVHGAIDRFDIDACQERQRSGFPSTSPCDKGIMHNITTLPPATQPSLLDSAPSEISVTSSTEATRRNSSLTDLASPIWRVSAFCRAVLSEMLPPGFWGTGVGGNHNRQVFEQKVHEFISLRRFESMSLHHVLHGFQISKIAWLAPPDHRAATKLAASDFEKRGELLSELLYYVFDSLVIPIIRGHFYVTESAVHRNRLFFFRHDVWLRISQPALVSLKSTMFEGICRKRAKTMLDAHPLSYGRVRLLPKDAGIRPIMNFRRRPMEVRNGRRLLGRSVNSLLRPVHSVLRYEKKAQPAAVGAALFSVGDMYEKLKTFKSQLGRDHLEGQPLFFAKVDVQSCFDTIPQEAVMGLIETLVREEEYTMRKHVELRPVRHDARSHLSGREARPSRAFALEAQGSSVVTKFPQRIEEHLARGKRHLIFVDQAAHGPQRRNQILELLRTHVQRNVVLMGKKFYMQTAGIPQGSVLSSLLCSFFYTDLENKHLKFVREGGGLLLRLIDDFLLITPDQDDARRFLQTMHDGLVEYGVRINPNKSLANFEATINGVKVPRHTGDERFPYCGNSINTRTLAISRDRVRRNHISMRDTLTVESFKLPGKSLQRKVLDSFKIQAHAMFFDTDFNSTRDVLSNIYQAFVETAMKFYSYAKCMLCAEELRPEVLRCTFDGLIDLAVVLIKSKHKDGGSEKSRCGVGNRQVRWRLRLAAAAFTSVLSRKQTKYGTLMMYLGQVMAAHGPRSGGEKLQLRRVVGAGQRAYEGYRY
ncbi:MAG: hypothetical protein M1817_001772 [Caeruleum heppii]|nr:MAG: hypothetical protein M1817_001772 [Caeruleum heppii]